MSEGGNEPGRRGVSVGAALSSAAERLRKSGVASPEVDAARLIEGVTGWGRTEQLVRRSAELSPAQEELLESLIARREGREPLQLILGVAHFLDLELTVAPGVLVPRLETERLVELVTEELAGTVSAGSVLLDVGSGTGALALALKSRLPDLEVWATDVSSSAVDMTRENAVRLGLRVTVRLSDLLSEPDVRAAAARSIAVVSNPPYLPDGDRSRVDPEVLAEPDSALYAGPDGLRVVRRLVEQAEEVLPQGALLALELDPRNVRVSADELRGWADVRVENDLTGRERFLLARR